MIVVGLVSMLFVCYCFCCGCGLSLIYKKLFDDERNQISREPNIRYVHEPSTEVVEMDKLPSGYSAPTRRISSQSQKQSHGSFPSAPFAGQILKKWTKPKSNESEHAEKSKCNDELEPYMSTVQCTEGP